MLVRGLRHSPVRQCNFLRCLGIWGFQNVRWKKRRLHTVFFLPPKKERKKKDKMHKLKSNLIFQSRVSHVGNSFRAFWRFFHVRQNIVFLDNKSTKPKVGGDVFFYQKKEMKAFSVLLESGWFHQKQKVSEQKAENLFIFIFFVCKTCQSKTATCMLTCFCNTLKCKITRTRLRKGFWCQFNNYRYTTKDMPGESRWLPAGLVLHVSALLPFFFFLGHSVLPRTASSQCSSFRFADCSHNRKTHDHNTYRCYHA